MKVLILSCNTGQGHNSVSGAVAGILEKRGVSCIIADALSFVSEWASKTVCEWHVRLYRYFPKTSGLSYSIWEQHPELFDERSPVHQLLGLGVDKLYKYISSGGYEAVICPHVISGLMVTDLMKQYPDAKLRTCFIATDYTCSPMCDESSLDLYFIPTASLIPEFEAIGIDKEKIVVTDGIPVRADFYHKKEKSAARAELGLPENCRHALMMFGSMGCGPMQKLAGLISRNLPENGILTVVCGTNEAVYRRMSKEFSGAENVIIKGFVKDISTLMDSADLFITKPGGLSTAEAAVKRLPMVLDNAVSGCEQYNLEYFCSTGAAMTAEGAEKIAKLCCEILSDDLRLEAMRKNLPERKNAAEQIVERMFAGYESAGAPKKIDNEFVYWRERCGLSQSELSRIMGIPRRTLRGWETGESEPPEYIKRLIISELKRISRRIARTKGISESE